MNAFRTPCPNCGAELDDGDLWELFQDGNDYADIECPHCEDDIRVAVWRDVRYEAARRKSP